MASRHLLVTGAAGFLGSALIVALRKRGAAVTALDLRPPAPELLRDAPGVRWLQLDIADEVGVRQAFPAAVASQGPLSAVIHLAAYYHFGVDERPQYQRTNREGTRIVHQAARACGARRMIFASSMIALEPPADGRPLTESSPADGWTPYGRSKAFGEELLAQEAAWLPAVVLRIGGIFSDWCELPPLYSLLRMWTGPGISNRWVVGQGRSAIPYLHLDDWTDFVGRVLERENELGPYEVFLAAAEQAVSHLELFSEVRRLQGRSRQPWSMPPAIARAGLHGRNLLWRMLGREPFEQPWMLGYIDRPWLLDTRHTRRRLGWAPGPGRSVVERLGEILIRSRTSPRQWRERNLRRAARG